MFTLCNLRLHTIFFFVLFTLFLIWYLYFTGNPALSGKSGLNSVGNAGTNWDIWKRKWIMDALNFKMPPNACNSHLHIIDPAFPNDGKAASQAGTVEAYRAIADALSLPRAVFVQPKTFSLDNSCLLAAIAKFGPENARGIAVVDRTVSDAELEALHNDGVRGIRFSVWNPKNAVVSFDDCLPLSERIKDLNWNVQMHMSAAQIAQNADVIRKLPCKIVIDHMGRLDPRLGVKDPAFDFLREMIDRGHTWIKISGPYLNTVTGKPWEDATAIARAVAAYAPERVVWGSDFPHVTEKEKPSEFELTAMIPLWFPNEAGRVLALVNNPEELYDF